jgi:vancomycin resistance protein YoaR
MPRYLRIVLVVLLVPISLVLMVGIVFAVDRATNGGEVLGEVSVADRQLGGLSNDDARDELQALEEELLAAPIPIRVAGTSFEIDPAEIGFDIDENAMLESAMAHGREGTIQDQFSWWVDHFGDEGIGLDIPYTFDGDAVRRILSDWEVEGIADEPFEGDVALVDGEPVISYPRTGTGIDVEGSLPIVEGTLLDFDRTPVDLPTRPIEPTTRAEELEAVAAEARALFAGDITLVNPAYDAEIVIPQAVVAEAVGIVRHDGGDLPSFEVTWSDDPIVAYVEPLTRNLGTEPRDAEWTIDDEVQEVVWVESVPGMRADPDAAGAQAREVALTPARLGFLPFVVGEQPDFTTADLEEFGVRELIGEFTTYHNCCESRVINIQLIADAVDGAIVLPGETWSLNDHVGQRTSAKGYVPAGAIIRGELYCCDDPINIGGGTSQFTTTLYNAIFFAGLEDVDHTPHSIWFPRYPEGREATLGFPAPDLVFRNNTDAAVVIRTSHTDTSITARIYGDNGGIEVEAGLSERYNYSGIVERRVANPDIPPGEENIKQAGSGGWSVDIYRYITYPDGTQTTEEWTWHYSGGFRIIEVNPCELTNTCPPTGGGDGP